MRTLTLTKLFGLIILAAFVLIDFGGCKTSSEDPVDPGWAPAGKRIVYTRNVDKIVNHEDWHDDCVWIKIELTRPKNPGKSEIYLRVFEGTLVKIAENTFEGYISEPIAYDRTHTVFANDSAFYDGQDRDSSLVGKYFDIQDGVITQALERKSHFEMIKPN